jgi:basic membrane protein A
MRFDKVVVVLVLLALVAGACAPAKPAGSSKTFAMVTDQNGLGDQGFNDSAWAGLQMAQKELGITPKVSNRASSRSTCPT